MRSKIMKDFKTEAEFLTYIRKLNQDIDEENLVGSSGPAKKALDEECMLRAYRSYKMKLAIMDFRKEHNCIDCLFFRQPGGCEGADSCKLEEIDGATSINKGRASESSYVGKSKADNLNAEGASVRNSSVNDNADTTRKCPNSPDGKCPYANESGTCFFGGCLREQYRFIMDRSRKH